MLTSVWLYDDGSCILQQLDAQAVQNLRLTADELAALLDTLPRLVLEAALQRRVSTAMDQEMGGLTEGWSR